MPAQLHEVKVQLSKSQINKLRQGLAIRLSANKMSGPHMLMVSKSLANKIRKHRLLGKGAQIKLCQRGIQGSGIFGDAFNWVKHAASTAVKGVVRAAPKVFNVVKKGVKYGIDHKKDIMEAVKTAIEIGKTVKELKGGDIDPSDIDEMVYGEGVLSELRANEAYFGRRPRQSQGGGCGCSGGGARQTKMTARERKAEADMASQSLSHSALNKPSSTNIIPAHELYGRGLTPSGGGLRAPGDFMHFYK